MLSIKNKAIMALLTLPIILFNFTAFANTSFLTKARDMYNVKMKGIIHIGASDGQEKKFYRSIKAKNVLWIEADPETYKKLVENVTPSGVTKILNNLTYPSTITENFAVSDQNGTADFFITSNKYSSSLLELNLHESVYPDIYADGKITVNTKRLDTYFEESKNDPSKYNVIMIDVQGAELLALKGATNTLKNIDVIVSEISPDEMYKGSVPVYELDKFLLEHDFVRVDSYMITKICGDALYIKKNIIRKSMTE